MIAHHHGPGGGQKRRTELGIIRKYRSEQREDIVQAPKKPKKAVNGGGRRQRQDVGPAGFEIAQILRGKHKPTFSPHVDVGDFVIATNCEKIAVTGDKLDNVRYYRHSLSGGLGELHDARAVGGASRKRVLYEGREGHGAEDQAGRRPK